MNIANMSAVDLIGLFAGLVFTLFVFSYIFGDNILFRLAIHIFIGVSAGYAVVVAWYYVIWPQLLRPMLSGSQSDRLFVLIPLILAVLLLAKTSSRLAGWGSLPVAYLVGVGVATAIGGAVLGTLFPQISASVNLFDQRSLSAGFDVIVNFIEAGLILLGTITTLIYFQFGARPRPDQAPRRSSLVESLAWVGQFFIAVSLGAVFAGIYTTALTSLVERSNFVVTFLWSLIQP
jgi:hypothetical protein